jgi:predicted PurR-regulated permease PerM
MTPESPESPSIRPRAGFTAARVTATAAVLTLLYFAHVAFVPIALAMLAFLVLSWPVEALRTWHVPRGASAAFLMALMLATLVAIANMLWEPAQQWFAAAPHTLKVIERKVRPFAQVVARIDQLRNSASNLGAAPRPPSIATPAPGPAAPEESAPVMLYDATRSVALSCVTVIILTLFLLIGGPPMLAQMAAAFSSELKSAHIIGTIEQVRREVGRFYATTALINIGLALATSLVMMACGMPNPFLWGTLAGLLNFVPYAGAAATLIVLSLVATVSFDSLARILAVPASFLALTTIEGQFIQPLLVGRRLQLNPMLVFLALWLGGLFWGVAGIILAMPSLVTLKVVAAASRGGSPLLVFLSPQALDLAGEVDVQQARTTDQSVTGSLRNRGPLPPPA